MPFTSWRIESATIAETIIHPRFDGRFVWKRVEDAIYYRKELKSEITFYGEDYTLLMALESVCEELTVTVKWRCDPEGALEDYWRGKFTLEGARFNLDECTVTVKPIPLDTYTCLREGWETDQNIYDLDVVPVQGYGNDYYETELAILTDPTTEPADFAYPISPGDWCPVPESDSITIEPDETNGGANHFVRRTTWHRIVTTSVCFGGVPSPPADSFFTWTLLDGTCPNPTYWRCPLINETAPPDPELEVDYEIGVGADMNYGRDFKEVVETIITGLDCDLSVVSNFFDINADESGPANDAYAYAEEYLWNMTVHQKSDVKRPYADPPALKKIYTLKPKDFLDDLRLLFNVYFDIVEVDSAYVLRLEHASYWTQGAGLNLLGAHIKRQYENDYTDQPKRELFYYMDEQAGDSFLASPIEYPCGAVGDKEYRCKVVSTDILWIQNYQNAEIVSDQGWVIVSNFDGPARIVRDENLALAWPNLHANLHLHWKAWPEGTVNGDPVEFLSYRRQRKAPPFLHLICCDTPVDPAELPTTDLGVGEVDTLEINVATDEHEFILKY